MWDMTDAAVGRPTTALLERPCRRRSSERCVRAASSTADTAADAAAATAPEMSSPGAGGEGATGGDVTQMSPPATYLRVSDVSLATTAAADARNRPRDEGSGDAMEGRGHETGAEDADRKDRHDAVRDDGAHHPRGVIGPVGQEVVCTGQVRLPQRDPCGGFLRRAAVLGGDHVDLI
jgi:hypothetical protein